MMSYIPRLKTKYREEIVAKLHEQFGYKTVMQVPRLLKISVNQGVGGATQDKKMVDNAVNEMSTITGQKAVSTIASKSISNFKLREFMPIGARVTLRDRQMYEFLDRLVTIALPRVRDFRGISGKSFDGAGNYSFGLKEQIVFPEINYDKIDQIRGMDIIIVTSAKTNDEAKALLKAFDMPLTA